MEDNIHYKGVMDRLFSIITPFLFFARFYSLPHVDKWMNIHRGLKQMEGTIYSLLPPVLAIIVVVLTRKVLLSLGVGILAAAFVLTKFSIVESANLNIAFLSFILFVIAGIMAFSTGTFGIMLPIAGDIAASTDVSLLLPSLAAVLAGLSSLISIVETFVAGTHDKFGVSRKKSVAIAGGLATVISLLFATQGGLFFLDVADYFINNFGIALAGLVEVVVVAWVLKELKNLQEHTNSVSDIMLGGWWRICLSIITPIVLGYMMFDNIKGAD